MWEINLRGNGDESNLKYQEASLADLPSFDSPPVKFLGRTMGAEESALAQLEKAIPTWLRDKEIEDDLLTRAGDDLSEEMSVVAFRIPEREQVSGWVWIDQSFVLIRKPVGPVELEVVYTVSDEDHKRALRIENQLGGPSTATLEWFGTIGTQTTVISGESTLKGGGRVKRALIYVSKKSGWLVGRVVRNRIASQSRRLTDPLWERRKNDLESRNRGVASQIPDIREVDLEDIFTRKNPVEHLVVLIHGTLSCGMRMAVALEESGLGPSPNCAWLRYEHDTFLPITDNAQELAELIEPISGLFESILLVCHSRGGLVGVTAAGQLMGPFWDDILHWTFATRGRRGPRIEVCTFGTPHLGTPIAAGAEGVSSVLRALAKSSSRMAFNSLGLDPAGWVAGWAIGRISFPRGVAAMSPDSDFIALYRRQGRQFPITVAGGYYDPDSEDEGYFAAAKRNALAEIMDGRDHDGVVPLESCLGIGDLLCEPARQCGHSDYFSRDDTLELLRARLDTGEWPIA